MVPAFRWLAIDRDHFVVSLTEEGRGHLAHEPFCRPQLLEKIEPKPRIEITDTESSVYREDERGGGGEEEEEEEKEGKEKEEAKELRKEKEVS